MERRKRAEQIKRDRMKNGTRSLFHLVVDIVAFSPFGIASALGGGLWTEFGLQSNILDEEDIHDKIEQQLENIDEISFISNTTTTFNMDRKFELFERYGTRMIQVQDKMGNTPDEIDEFLDYILKLLKALVNKFLSTLGLKTDFLFDLFSFCINCEFCFTKRQHTRRTLLSVIHLKCFRLVLATLALTTRKLYLNF